MAVKTNTEINGNKYYKVTKTIGHKSDGTPIKKQFYGLNKSDAEEKANQYIDLIGNGVNLDLKDIDINTLVSIWLYDIKMRDSNFKPSTFTKYEGIYRNYIQDSEIALIKVSATSVMIIQKYYNKLSKNGKSESQIKNLNKVIKGAFNYAIQERLIPNNPCQFVTIPKEEKDDFDETEDIDFNFFTKEDLLKILEECKTRIKNKDTDYLPYLIYFSLCSGLRLGESTGLQNKFFSDYIVKVRKELAKVKVFKNKNEYTYEYKLIPVKTKTSVRDVNIPTIAFNTINNYIESVVKSSYSKNNQPFNENSLIFVNSSCGFIDQSNLRKKWKKFLKDINVEYKKWHRLRAGCACLLFESGVDIKTVQELLGHSDINTTINIYLKVFPNSKKGSVNNLNSFLE